LKRGGLKEPPVYRYPATPGVQMQNPRKGVIASRFFKNRDDVSLLPDFWRIIPEKL